MKDHPIIFSAPMVKALHPKMNQWNESRKINLDHARVTELFSVGMTAVEIAKEFGCSTSPVKKVFKELGLRRPAKRRAGVGVGINNPAWKGGRRIRPDGYVVIWTPKGEELEHRVAMSNVLGRPLSSNEIVHHIDGDPSNNDPDNLQLLTQSEHAKHHAPEMHHARYGP